MSSDSELHASQGLVICNIGMGKGKTTAAMGTCVRAAGAGMNVYIIQFVKAKVKDGVDRTSEGEWPLSAEIEYFNEVDAIVGQYKQDGGKTTIGRIQNQQVGIGFVGILGDQKAKAEHIQAARQGLRRAEEVLASGEWGVVFLDEVLSALEVELITEEDILNLIKIKPKQVHLIITGHNKYDKILEQCDMVTEMKMVQHPYYKGILAQRGIDY